MLLDLQQCRADRRLEQHRHRMRCDLWRTWREVSSCCVNIYLMWFVAGPRTCLRRALLLEIFERAEDHFDCVNLPL